MTIKRGGHTFAGFDKPIRTPNHPSGKSHAVVVKDGDKAKLIRFRQQGAKTKRPRKGESAADKAKRASFKACLLYTSPSPRDKRQSRMPSSA